MHCQECIGEAGEPRGTPKSRPLLCRGGAEAGGGKEEMQRSGASYRAGIVRESLTRDLELNKELDHRSP